MAETDSAAGGRSDAADADGGEEEPSDDEPGDTWVAVNPPHGSSQPVLKRVTPPQASSVPSLSQKIAIPAAQGSSAAADSEGGKLSKADRKAMKKKLLDERIKRQQGKASHW